MKDIELAIEKEKQYFADRKFSREVSIYDYIRQAGYDDVDEFNIDRSVWYLKNLDMYTREVSADEFKDSRIFCDDAFLGKKNSFLYNINKDKTFVLVPDNCTLLDKIEPLGISLINAGYNTSEGHGVIITMDGDLDLIITVQDYTNINVRLILQKLCHCLSDYYNDVVISGNDVLVNGKKVIGTAGMDLDYHKIIFVHASFNDVSQIVNAIGLHGEKTPGYIDVITAVQLKDIMMTWLH